MKKSILAKLLAKENITVQHGNYETAWFDIKNRVLGLPQWKDTSKDVLDLLIGHEVGHALETPYEGWHDSEDNLEGCPRSYINVIEDARIERKIKDRYKGLVGPFARGYKTLFEKGFFGSQDLDWDQVKLIDKINLKAKVGAHLNVPFNSEEEVFYSRSMVTDTFDDVVDLVRDIYDYTKENQPELLTQPPAPQGMPNPIEDNEDQGPMGGHDDALPNDETNDVSDQAQDAAKNDETESSASDENRKADSASDAEQSEKPEGEQSKSSAAAAGPVEESLTDKIFRQRESTLLDTGESGLAPLRINEPNKDAIKDCLIDFKVLNAERKRKLTNRIFFEYSENEGDYNSFVSQYKEYMKQVKRNVGYAVKEFEMKKAAYRYTRAQTAKTGSIDVNRLWSYKTNDDIFNRVTRLADAKNHGMIMLVDFSGSMNGVMSNVMDQLLHTIMFCKAVNIPYDVYAFTSRHYEDYTGSRSVQLDSEAYLGDTRVTQLLSSKLSKSEFIDGTYHMFMRKIMDEPGYGGWDGYLLTKYDEYGSTPLNSSLIVMTKVIKDFIAKNNTDNMNLVVISDGETNSLDLVHKNGNAKTDFDSYNINMQVDGNVFNTKNRRGLMTTSLLENLQKTYNVTTQCFYIAGDRHEYNMKIAQASSGDRYTYIDEDSRKQFQREYSKNRCLTFDNALGYNKFYILKKDKMSTEAEEFEVNEHATHAQIRSAFKKHSTSKKSNKTLLTNFGRTVAV